MDTDFQSVASEFFDSLGWSSTQTLVVTSSEYNPATSDNEYSETPIPVKVIVFDYVSKSEGDTTKTNTLIRTGDKQVFLKPNESFSDIDPSSDYLLLNGKRYAIITVKAVNPSLSVPIYYELFVRA